MDLTSVIAALLALVPAEYAVYVLALCGACAVAAALWKRPADGSKWLALYLVVNALGCNFLAARNNSKNKTVSAPPPAAK